MTNQLDLATATTEGLTLTGANKSVLFDPPWTQAKPDQAAARINRPGQERETECLHLITAGTVEEKVGLPGQDSAQYLKPSKQLSSHFISLSLHTDGWKAD